MGCDNRGSGAVHGRERAGRSPWGVGCDGVLAWRAPGRLAVLSVDLPPLLEPLRHHGFDLVQLVLGGAPGGQSVTPRLQHEHPLLLLPRRPEERRRLRQDRRRRRHAGRGVVGGHVGGVGGGGRFGSLALCLREGQPDLDVLGLGEQPAIERADTRPIL
eukprot:scaffold4491_cov119-Isochrysis_galbana.AAC.7